MAKFRLTAILFYILICFSTARADESISVTQSIDRTEIAYEDSANFEIKVQWKGDQARYRFYKPLDPYFDRLKVGNFSSSVASSGSGPDETTTKTFKFSLKPTSGGTGKIDPGTISYVSWPDSIPGELVTQAISISIAQPKPPKKPIGSGIWYWLGGILLLIIIVIVVILRITKPKNVAPVLTPAEEALQGLTALKKEAGDDFKRYQSGLLKLLLEYLKRYGIVPDDLTEEKLMSATAAINLNDLQRERIVKWIIKANEDKFKPVSPEPGELLRLQTEVTDFFKNM